MLKRADWPAPDGVEAGYTTRVGGVSSGPWAALNLGMRCGDVPAEVEENRRRLGALLPAPPLWLHQVHGTRLIAAAEWQPGIAADAIWTAQPATVLAILTADCLPLLLAGRRGDWVAALHCGWRGLAAGIIEKTLADLPAAGAGASAWLGPAICAAHYPVGDEVRDRLIALSAELAPCFSRRGNRWHADLYGIVRHCLCAAGVTAIFGGARCTHHEPETFFSYRRDRATGRQAAMIWIN